jgi:uncharacterized protein
MQMLISIDEILQARQPFGRDVAREWLDEQLAAEPATGFRCAGPSHLNARLTRIGRNVLVEGSFVALLRGECRRCLKPVELTATVSFTRTFVPAAELPAERPARENPRDDDRVAGSFAEQQVYEETFDGRTFDLAPTVREELLLEAPEMPLCREDCRGLCPVCGADRNAESCGHEVQFADPRWAALKDVKLH